MVNAVWFEVGLLYLPKVERLRKQSTKFIASANLLSIVLGEKTPSWRLLHELAYFITSILDEVLDGHSSHFMGNYLKVLARYLRVDLLALLTSAALDQLVVDLEASPVFMDSHS